MTRKKAEDEIDSLVYAKFGDYDSCEKNCNSPNARHYLLMKSNNAYHLKLVKKTYLDTNDDSEILLLKSINSEYIIKLLDSGDIDKDWSYLLFPHIDGKTLNNMHTENGWSDEKLQQLIKDVMSGFDDMAVAKIVHRDIKPKNIIYDNVSKKFIILDLGIGYFMEKPNKNNSQIPKGVGPMYYTAPEQFKIAVGEPYSISSSTDQFSFGVVLYELATNSHPFIKYQPDVSQSYASLVLSDDFPQAISAETGLSAEMRETIGRMLRKEPCERFLTTNDLLLSIDIGSNLDSKSTSKMYYKMPNKSKDNFIEFVERRADEVSGIIITPSDSQDYADKLNSLGIYTILDPMTYNLQANTSAEFLSTKLGVPYNANHSAFSLYKIKEQLINGAKKLSDKMHSDVLVLPYFNIKDDSFLTFTKEIWNESRDYFNKNGQTVGKVYGALIIPHSVTINPDERVKLMSKLLDRYPLDGIIISFEDVNKSIITTTEEEFIKGAKEFCNFFETIFEDVIINRCDISFIPLSNRASYVVGWSKSFRHFTTAPSGGGGSADYKMKYYADKLFTFIEEKSKIQTIVLMGKKSYLDCSCGDCSLSKPLEPTYVEDELCERSHFFNAIANIQSILNGKTINERKAFFIEYLNECNLYGDIIKSTGIVGNETIPSYKGIVAVINN